MSWVTMLTTSIMVVATAFLVMAQGWTYMEAVGAVTGIMLLVIASLWSILLLLTPPWDRPQLRHHVIKAMRLNLKGLIDALTGKSGP